MSVQVYISRLQWGFHQSRTSIGDSGKQNRINEHPDQLTSSSSLGSPKQPKWAYAFLVAGCDPDSPLTYRNYFFNILVASNLLDTNTTDHSTDILVMIQLTRASNATELPQADLEWLQTQLPNNPNRILRIHYLPPLIRDNFYNSHLEKYSKILCLDADVMPLCNLDYLFEESQNGKLQPNVVLAGYGEPAQGGFFLLEPGEGYHQELLQIIAKRETSIKWNSTLGWGTVMEKEWKGIPTTVSRKAKNQYPAKHSRHWDFHGGFADQGLLYYWTRFYKQKVSIVFLDTIENWQNGNLLKTCDSAALLGKKTCSPKGVGRRGQFENNLKSPLVGKIPHQDFTHFTGNQKPWEVKVMQFPKSLQEVKSSTDHW